jgi:hypothetical protein
MRGPKFSELVDNAAAFYRPQSEKIERIFLGKAALMLPLFGNRIAATLTTMEFENWLLDEADEHEWAPGLVHKTTTNRVWKLFS